jgi:hypothetical protein
MSQVIAKVGIALLTKLITESFLSKLLIETLRAWAKTSDNAWDDKVVEAMADSLGVDKQKLVS